MKKLIIFTFLSFLTSCAVEGNGLYADSPTELSTYTETYTAPKRGSGSLTQTVTKTDVQTQTATNTLTITSTYTNSATNTVSATDTASNTNTVLATQVNTYTYTGYNASGSRQTLTLTTTNTETYTVTKVLTDSTTNTYTTTALDTGVVDLCVPGSYGLIGSGGRKVSDYPGVSFTYIDHSFGEDNDILGPSDGPATSCSEYLLNYSYRTNKQSLCQLGLRCGYCKVLCGW